MGGTPFNDAYRYMDWLLTVPLLLMEIVLVMNLPPAESRSKCWTLGIGSALMIVSGYKGELVISGNLGPRWQSWCFSMCFFLWVVYTLLIGGTDAVISVQIGYCISDIISKCGVGLMIYQITITKSMNERMTGGQRVDDLK